MTRYAPLAIAFLTLLLAGCGFEKTWVASDPMQLTAKPGGYDMPVSRGGTDRAHKILGELSVTTQIKPNWSTENSHEAALRELRKEAIKRGADAIIDLKTSGGDRGGHSELTVTGHLILFTGPPPLAARG